MPNKSIRRSLSMTLEMAERLKHITTGRPRNTAEADLTGDVNLHNSANFDGLKL